MWQQQFIETARGTFQLFTKGHGAPLCVTHLYSEFNENGNVFAEMFTPHFTVHLVNLRGCGQSTDDGYDYSMSESVRDLEAVREALHIETWGFAGHSTGGMLALKYAELASTSLTHIVAGGHCASSAYMRNPASIYCADNPNNARIRDILAMLGNPASTFEERRAGNQEWTLMSLYDAASYDVMMSRPNSGKTVSKRLDYFTQVELKTFDLNPILPTLRTTAYIYGGVHDAQCPYEYAASIAELMPNATLTTFEKSNHFPFIEEEAAFAQFVGQIVQQQLTV